MILSILQLYYIPESGSAGSDKVPGMTIKKAMTTRMWIVFILTLGCKLSQSLLFYTFFPRPQFTKVKQCLKIFQIELNSNI